MFHNTMVREKVEFKNPFRLGDHSREPVREPDILNDYDSILTIFTLRNYLTKMTTYRSNSENTLKLLDTIISEIGKLLPGGKEKTITTQRSIKRSITLKSHRSAIRRPRPGVDRDSLSRVTSSEEERKAAIRRGKSKVPVRKSPRRRNR